MPLNFHKYSNSSARAALAAGEQGKFWEFHDELFAISPNLDSKAIMGIATKLGLDIDKFRKDMNSPAVKEKIAKDIRDAKAAGVTGTPTIFVDGIKVKDRNLPAIQQIIDEELETKGVQ